MVWALALLLVLLMPEIGLAEEATNGVVTATVDPNELEGVENKLDQLNTVVDTRTQLILDKMGSDESSVDEDDSNLELDQLISIDQHLTQLIGETTNAGLMEQAPLGANSLTAFVAYTNCSPTSQYANYSASMLPKLDWKDHYCYVQDTSSSYAFVWGDLTLDDTGTFSGEGKYIRWYFAGNNYGYRVESGEGTISVTSNGYTVLSDLGEYPILGDVQELQRREVGFYAVVAIAVFCLFSVWSFSLRNAQHTS